MKASPMRAVCVALFTVRLMTASPTRAVGVAFRNKGTTRRFFQSWLSQSAQMSRACTETDVTAPPKVITYDVLCTREVFVADQKNT
eukprot:3211090-Amphidinium_carterae.1